MIGSDEWVSAEVRARHACYDRIIAAVTWLFIALVALHLYLLPFEAGKALLVAVCCLVLPCSRWLTSRFLPVGRLRGGINLALLLAFIDLICWYTGKASSPFVCGICLAVMASSLTLGRQITCFMAALAVGSYTLLALAQPPADLKVVATVLQVSPFILFACLGALLSAEVERAHGEVEKLSLTDDLTELHNMRSFQALALHMEKLCKRYRKPYAICMLDADNLKSTNDRHGHLAGTQLIKWTARIIQQNIRDCDVAARFGGDEFIIMFEGHTKEQILPAVGRIVEAMAASPFPFEGTLLKSTLSAGIACYPADASELRSVIMRADEAMYVSKRLGKNRASLYVEEEVRKTRRGLEVGGEQLGGAVPDLGVKGAAVDLGQGDLPGNAKGGGAAFLE